MSGDAGDEVPKDNDGNVIVPFSHPGSRDDHPAGADHPADKLSPHERKKFNQHLESEADKRAMRKWFFYAAGIAALAFLVLMFFALAVVIKDPTGLASALKDVKGAGGAVAPAIVIAMATIPLGIMVSIVKVISPGNSDDEINLPQLNLLRSLLKGD